MSATTHCDRLGCNNSKPSDGAPRQLCDEPWIRVYPDQGHDYDFCSRKCLAEWAAI